MENELIITRDIVEKFRIKSIVDTFNKIFSRGAKVTDIPKLIPHIDGIYYYRLLAQWLLNQLPFNNKILIIDGNTCDNLFYNGDVIIKGDAKLNRVYIKGNLEVNGNLTIKDKGEVIARDFDNKKQITATEINLCSDSMILAHIKANEIYAYNESVITGDINANLVIIKNGLVWGDVDADEIINEGEIGGDVNTIKIKSINGGMVYGNLNITYKRSDEHK